MKLDLENKMRQLNSPPTPTLESVFGTNASSYHYCTFTDCHLVATFIIDQTAAASPGTTPCSIYIFMPTHCHLLVTLVTDNAVIRLQYCHQRPLPLPFVHPYTALPSGNIYITDSTVTSSHSLYYSYIHTLRYLVATFILQTVLA